MFLIARHPCTTFSSKVNLPHAIDLRTLCGANLDTSHPGIRYHRNLRTPMCGTASSASAGLSPMASI